MDLYVLTPEYQLIDIIDNYCSIIWTRRFRDVGDFELYVPATSHYIEILKADNVIIRNDDDMICIIEKIVLSTSEESGNYLTVTGRSVESLLERRIVWGQTILSGTAENAIRKLITDNAFSPEIDGRRIPNFLLGPSNNFTETINMQMTGDNLLEAVKEICTTYNYGFKITLDKLTNVIVFNIYKGTDRSTGQNSVPFVMFSPSYDNLISTEYVYDKSKLKNVAYVAGEGEGKNRKSQTIGTAKWLDRYELFVDAKNISSNDGEISEEEYNLQLCEKGKEALGDKNETTAFSGQIVSTELYIYKTHFFVGDFVQIESNYGISAKAQILEIVECEDENGYSCLPTLSTGEEF